MKVALLLLALQLGQQPTPFLGGVPTGTVSAEPIALSIGDAINRRSTITSAS